ncbi:MAG: helix-turn-helix domain-containing protein [Sphingomonas paucimobilis]
MDLQDITGGTETPGIPPSLFEMRPGMAIRYEQPDPKLADYVTGYHLYAASGPGAMGLENWFLPGTANVRVTLGAGPIAVSIGRFHSDPLPQASLFGPTSHAIHTVTNGGVMIGFGISALGWARFFDGGADRYADRIEPLSAAARPGFADRLVALLSAVRDEQGVKPALDRFLLAEMGPQVADEDRIRSIARMVTDDLPNAVADTAASWDMSPERLRRLCKRHFGFVPKTLLIRARFLRSLVPLIESKGELDYSRIDPGYVSASHFLRDAHAVLGTTPRRFLHAQTEFLVASLRARAAVLGSATQALHRL